MYKLQCSGVSHVRIPASFLAHPEISGFQMIPGSGVSGKACPTCWFYGMVPPRPPPKKKNLPRNMVGACRQAAEGHLGPQAKRCRRRKNILQAVQLFGPLFVKPIWVCHLSVPSEETIRPPTVWGCHIYIDFYIIHIHIHPSGSG